MVIYLQYVVAAIYEWRIAILDRSFRLKLLLVPAIFIVYSFLSQQLAHFIQLREGVQLPDRLLTFIPRLDFSTEVFILLYTSLLIVVLTHLHKPKVVLRVIEMHIIVAIVRQTCILLIALEPPPGIIMIRDVFLENTVYPPELPLTKDLFFSGHVASMWIYCLCAQHKYLKIYLIFATFLMSIMVLCMRIHYTYDVYGALIFTSVIYFLPELIRFYHEKRSSEHNK